MSSIAHLLRRARARLLSRPLVAADSAQGTFPRKSPPEDHTMALPDDMLLEVFKRLPPLKDAIRCAAVCRRWCRIICSGARAGRLPTPPRHFGFFFATKLFVATKVGVNLDVGGFLSVHRGARIVDGRGGVLLLRESSRELKLKLIMCNPQGRSFRRLPTVNTTGYEASLTAFVPLQGAEFRVAVVLFSINDIAVLIYDSASASSGWKRTSPSLRRRWEPPFYPSPGPSVVVGDVVYSLVGGHVLVFDTTEMTLSMVHPPLAHSMWFDATSYWIGKTDDGRPCYFALDRSKLHLEWWALGADCKWTRLHPLRLPGEFGEMSSSSKPVTFAGFCEGSRMLFFIAHDSVVSFDIQTLQMERLWCCDTDDEAGRLRKYSDEVYPCEIAWPPRCSKILSIESSLSDQMQFGLK